MQIKLIDAKQEAKLNMYQVVEMRCDANMTIINNNVAFKNAYLDLKALVANITAETQKAGAVLTGITTDKSVSKQDLCSNASRIAGLIYAYAAKSGNNTLKKAVDFSKTDLTHLKDAELAPICQNIHDAGVENTLALKDYGVTTEKLAALQTAIDGYTGQIAAPRSAIVDRKTTKTGIKDLFKQVDAVLSEQMDNLIEDFAADNPDFVTAYKNARIIVDAKTKSTKPTGTSGTNPPA